MNKRGKKKRMSWKISEKESKINTHEKRRNVKNIENKVMEVREEKKHVKNRQTNLETR